MDECPAAMKANQLSPGSPAFGPFTIPFMEGETGRQWHKHQGHNSTQISGYAIARIGPMGQKVNWHLFGKDVPWIFSEIVDEVKADRSIETTHRTSVDIGWRDGSVIAGQTPFNNLNIYQASVDLENYKAVYKRKGLLEMNGHLEKFINSASGQWPEPEIPPLVQ